ncbi:MAG: UbiA family prenyltransferase, partial [Desulfobacterales bacterium]
RRLILATATNRRAARQVADYLQFFDLVLASDDTTNLSAARKRDRLVAEFGEHGFDYAGNDRSDLVVWSAARKAIVVNPEFRVRSAARRVAEVEQVFDDRRSRIMPSLKALRLHQWLKNLLLFVPLLAAHRLREPALIVQALVAFLAFGLCASSVYLLNDLIDLPADRRHPRKRPRPLAAGMLSLVAGMGLIPVLLGLSGLLSLFLPLAFGAMLALYYGLTLAYSFFLKRVVLLDVIVLAGLFTMRLMAGSAAVAIWPSSWLLGFSAFLFLSLALVKRYAELVTMRTVGGETATARGYQVGDRQLLAALGCASAMWRCSCSRFILPTGRRRLFTVGIGSSGWCVPYCFTGSATSG